MNENMSRIFDFMVKESEIPMAIDGYPLEHWDKLLLCDKNEIENTIHIEIRDEKEFTNTVKKLIHTLFSYWDINESKRKITNIISGYLLILFLLITFYLIYSLKVFEIYSLTDVVNTSKSTVWEIVFGNFLTLLILPIVLMFISVGISLSFSDYLKLKNRSNRIEKYCKIKYNIHLNNGKIPKHLGIKFNKEDKIKYIEEKKRINQE